MIVGTCKFKFKILSGMRRPQNGKTEHTSGHITSVNERRVTFRKKKKYREAYVLNLVLGLVKTIEESFNNFFGISQSHMQKFTRRNLKQHFWKQQEGLINFAPRLRVLNFPPIFLFSLD